MDPADGQPIATFPSSELSAARRCNRPLQVGGSSRRSFSGGTRPGRKRGICVKRRIFAARTGKLIDRRSNARKQTGARVNSVVKRSYVRRGRSCAKTCTTPSQLARRTNGPSKRIYNRRVPASAVSLPTMDSVPIDSTQSPTTLVSCRPVARRSSLPPPTRRTYCRRNPRSGMRCVRESIANNVRANASTHDQQEAFIQSLAIPTHLYRYLAQRHRHRPLYLNRTLSYLRPAPSSFSNSTHKTSKARPIPSVNCIADRLSQDQLSKRKSSCAHRTTRKSDFCDLIRDIRSPSQPYWPHEIHLIFEGFFDSEKELDWVTVQASVGLCFRFGWAWRHKPSPADTIVSPFGFTFPLTCLHTSTGLEHSSVASTTLANSCQFQPLELINRAKWLTSGGRLHSGQLEMRVNAIEKRWLKRPDLCRTNSTHVPNGLIQSATHMPPSFSRKGSLSSSAYPVHYSTAPVPLFYRTAISSNFDESNPFLLTPGVYELRLGVEHGETPYVLDKCGSAEFADKLRLNLCYGGGYPHEVNSTADSAATSTSDYPNGTASPADDTATLSDAGAASGRVEWRRIRFPQSSDAVDEYHRWPTLRFRVVWCGRASVEENEPSVVRGPETRKSDGLLNGTLEKRASTLRSGATLVSLRQSHKSILARCLTEGNSTFKPAPPPPISPSKTCDTNAVPVNGIGGCQLQQRPTVRPRKSLIRPHLADPTQLPACPVTYRFLYRGQLQQWSESKDLICPWCHLNCWRARERGPEALLVHLRTCHPRFRFKASWNSSRSHLSLEVSLNDAYDGSNDCGLRRWTCGLTSGARRPVPPGQLVGGWTGLGQVNSATEHVSSLCLTGCATRVACPVRRLPYTHLIFWRGAERTVDQPLDPTLSVQPMAIGHNRVYYHTRSVQPVRACEFDMDSEAEDAPNWLRQHYQRKVEEFSDVNQGEKQIMQLWNALLLSVSPSELVVCDSQIVNLAAYFLHQYAHTIHQRRLRCNLLIHFANLVDYGLLSAGQMRQLVTIYDDLTLPTRS